MTARRKPLSGIQLAQISRKLFFQELEKSGIPLPTPEYVFHENRKWRFDYAWVEDRLALEVDGAIWTNGRHTRGSGWLKDTEKLNTAASMGWRMLRVTPQQLAMSDTISLIQKALTAKAA